eukprot:GHVO01020924.1.p1 GENE.GHVO01020924.1~~GHVO01020924.1.p1  ORF type:complete len:143 (-),score=10.95 GHVO01020924.1:22-450(-)
MGACWNYYLETKNHHLHLQLPKRPKRSNLLVDGAEEEEGEEEHRRHVLDLDGLQQLWQDFSTMMEALRKLPGQPGHLSGEQFRAEAKLWAQNFRTNTLDEDVTPYIHCKYWEPILPSNHCKYKLYIIECNHVRHRARDCRSR